MRTLYCLYQYGKLKQVVKGMIKQKIFSLCEMRWTGCGKMKEDGKTIIYSGHSNDHTLGVRICLSSSVAKALVVWKPVNESIITARFQTRHAKAHTIP